VADPGVDLRWCGLCQRGEEDKEIPQKSLKLLIVEVKVDFWHVLA